jgi:hypothetical protein
MKKTLIFATATFALNLSSAFAGAITWPLIGTPGNLGNSTTLLSTTGNISMTFSGFITATTDVPTSSTWLAPTATASALFAKTSGGDESGLGLAADPGKDNEIFKNSFIQVDLTQLLAQKNINTLQLVIGSVQSGEGFDIWGSNTAAQPGTLLYAGNSSMDDVAFDVPSYGSYKYISISASANNVLLDSITGLTATPISSTPEPGSVGLGLISAIGLAALKLARRKA